MPSVALLLCGLCLCPPVSTHVHVWVLLSTCVHGSECVGFHAALLFGGRCTCPAHGAFILPICVVKFQPCPLLGGPVSGHLFSAGKNSEIHALALYGGAFFEALFPGSFPGCKFPVKIRGFHTESRVCEGFSLLKIGGGLYPGFIFGASFSGWKIPKNNRG